MENKHLERRVKTDKYRRYIGIADF